MSWLIGVMFNNDTGDPAQGIRSAGGNKKGGPTMGSQQKPFFVRTAEALVSRYPNAFKAAKFDCDSLRGSRTARLVLAHVKQLDTNALGSVIHGVNAPNVDELRKHVWGAHSCSGSILLQQLAAASLLWHIAATQKVELTINKARPGKNTSAGQRGSHLRSA